MYSFRQYTVERLARLNVLGLGLGELRAAGVGAVLGERRAYTHAVEMMF